MFSSQLQLAELEGDTETSARAILHSVVLRLLSRQHSVATMCLIRTHKADATIVPVLHVI